MEAGDIICYCAPKPVADSGGARPPPPLGKKCKRAHYRKIPGTTPPPLMNRVASGLWRGRKNESRAPHRLYGDYVFCYYPPPTESRRRLGTSHERGRPLRKILDLRLQAHN